MLRFAYLSLLICLCIQSTISAFNDEPACYQELKVSFFRPELVSQVLNMHQVVQSQWAIINKSLQDRSRGVPAIIKERAEAMGLNNPLEYPFNAEVALPMLWDVLYQIFATTLLSRTDIPGMESVNNPEVVRVMFTYLQEQQRDRINTCLGK